MKLRGRGVLITGASQGLGKIIAEACVAEGANVVLCARDKELLDKTHRELLSKAAEDQLVVSQPADVSCRDDVHRLFETAAAKLSRLDGVVNNAGVYGPKGLLEDVDPDTWCRAIEINLFGVVYVCRAALPVFRAQGHGKIINLSGGGATSPLPRISAYAASKAAVVRLTETLAEETSGAGIDVNAIAPGALNTRLLDEILEEGPERVGEEFYARALKQKANGGSSLSTAADLCIFLLSSASNGITGKLISAIWDPWRDFPQRKSDLVGTDLYTLRRIVPGDRGLKWE